jgi:uncharacterized protein YggE
MNKIAMIMGLMLAAMLAACQITVQQPGQQDTISVSGMAQFKVVPDEATVHLRVETNAATAQAAQDENSAKMTAIQKALRRAGVRDDQMQTQNYNLYPNYYWDNEKQRQVQDGYRVTHTLQLKTTELERVGEYIQLAVDSGANGVDSVQFSLSKAAEKDAKNEALRQAVQDARSKAEALADGLSMRLGKVSSVTINEYNVIPFYRGMAEAVMSKDMGGELPPPISPQDVDVMANVQVVFEIA